jgi:O-antigen/teichoic acid export membrane protein
MPISKLLQNIFSLTAAEIATKGITFFLYMYLARILSVEGYGIMSNIISIIGFFNIVVVFGINDIGIRGTSGQPQLVQKYFSNITSVKLFLAIISFFSLIIYVYFNDFSYMIAASFILGSIQLFAFSIHIEWVFIANERMNILAIRQILIGVVNLLGALIFVKSVNDMPLYFFITSTSLLINNLWIIKFAKIKFRLECDVHFIKSLLKQSIPLWFVTLFSYIMGAFGIVYLAYAINMEQTGLFSAAFKLTGFTIIPAFILLNAFAPQISQTDTTISKIAIAQKYSTFILVVGAIITAECFVFADFAIYITFGEKFILAANLLKILSFYVLCYYISTSANTLLRYWKYERKVSVSYLIATIIFIVVTIILSNLYNSTGTAIATIIGELSAAITLIIFLFGILHKVFILKIIPFLITAFSITLLFRFIIELFTNNIYYIPIAMLLSLIVYFIILLKLKLISYKL